MKRQQSSGPLEFTVGPHPARYGWEVVRITFNPADPSHARQVEAAITALVQARAGQKGGGGHGEPEDEAGAQAGGA